jgi:hypothetical protein
MFVTPGLQGAQIEELHRTHPLQTFGLTLAQVVAQASVTDAQELGWQQLIRRKGKLVASADAVPYGEPGDWVCSEIYEGPYIAGTEHAAEVAHNIPAVLETLFVPRLLRMDALYLLTLWLSSADPGQDLIAPIGPAPAPYGLDVDGCYAPGDLLAYLSARASEISAVDTGP